MAPCSSSEVCAYKYISISDAKIFSDVEICQSKKCATCCHVFKLINRYLCAVMVG